MAAEERKLAAEAEERKLAAEAEERILAAEAAEREAERKHKLEMEKLRLEYERLNKQKSASSEDQQAALSQASQNAVARIKAPVLPGFVDGKDSPESYLLRFERYATDAGWNRSDWATRLSPLLSGRPLDVYSGLSDEQARDYDKLQKALLQRYDFTEQGYRERFRGAKPEGQESPSQFIVRMSNYFDKWVELAGGDKTFKGVSELMVREQFTNSCPKDVSVFLKERSPKNLEELAKLAEYYLNAHGKKLSTKAPVTKQDVKTSLLRTNKNAMRCYVCDGRGHRAVECPSKASTSRNEPFGHGRQSYCFKCGATGHEAHECKTALQRSQPGSRAGGRGPGGNPTQTQRVACAMQVPRRSDEKEAGFGMDRHSIYFCNQQ